MNSDYSDYKGVNSIPSGACHRYIFCGNTVPGENKTKNEMCDECLSELRAAGRGHDAPTA